MTVRFEFVASDNVLDTLSVDETSTVALLLNVKLLRDISESIFETPFLASTLLAVPVLSNSRSPLVPDAFV